MTEPPIPDALKNDPVFAMWIGYMTGQHARMEQKLDWLHAALLKIEQVHDLTYWSREEMKYVPHQPLPDWPEER